MNTNLRKEIATLHGSGLLDPRKTIDQKIEALLELYFANNRKEVKVKYNFLCEKGFILIQLTLGSLKLYFTGNPIDVYRFLLTKSYEVYCCKTPQDYFFLERNHYLVGELMRSKFAMTYSSVGKIGVKEFCRIIKNFG